MAKKANFDTSFNFGANAQRKKGKTTGKKAAGKKSGAWRAYTTGGKKR